MLLDTSAWLWLLTEPDRFSVGRRAQLASPATELFLSAASSWEISIKYSIGKLALPERPERYIPRMLEATNTSGLMIKHVHALRVAELPLHHRDPFDRMLVAQAQIEKLPILSADPQIGLYAVKVLPL